MRKFTKLIAALALLLFMTPAMVGWGQTRETISLTFPLTSNPGGWPTTNSTTLTNYTYSLSGVNYTFALKNVKCNSGYLMMTSTAVLGLPAIDGYKLTTVVASNSSGCSTSTKVGISSSATQASYIGGGAIQTWSTTSSSYTYNLTSTEANTMYYMYVTNKNAQVVDLALTYESTGGTPVPSMSVSTNSIDFGSENTINPANPYTETFEVTFDNLTQNLTVTGFTGVSVSPTTINYNATSPQTVTVSYNPTTAGSISGNISVNSTEVTEALVAVTGSAYDPSNIDTYERYTGALVEGDYIICANAEVAMKNVISSSRFANQDVTVSDNKITNPDASIIWHIAPDGDYYTMYNAAVGKYAAGTTSNNQGALIDAVTDYARWDITYQYSNYTVICYGRNSSTNKYLRRNSTYGWATYANSTGNVPTFYKKVVTNQVAMPEFSLAAGTYYETKNVTLSCATDGATIYYTTDGTTPSASNGTEYTTAISVSTTTTIKAIAVKSGMADSDVATATYTIELPLSTMNQIFAAATEAGNNAATVRIALGNWVVTGANSSSHAFVSDGTNGFMIYASGHGFSAGDVLSGTVECNVQLYNGAAEITQLTSSTTGLTVTTGGTVTVSNTEMADLAGINTGALVSYQNLTCEARVEGNYTNYYLSDGTTEIQAYKTLLDNYADYLEDGKIYNITGVFVLNNSTKRINPRSADDIVEVQVQHNEYTLTVSNLVHVTTYVFDASNQNNALLVGAGQVNIYDGTQVMISVDVEEGYVIESLMVDGDNVTSQIEADAYTFTMPTHAVTITATAVESVTPPTPGDGNYVRITSLDQLTNGSIVVIAARYDENDVTAYYAMKNTIASGKASGVAFTSITSNSQEILPTTIVTDEGDYYWTVAVTNNVYTFTNSNGDVISYNSSTNFNMNGDKSGWTITTGTAGSTTMVPGYAGFIVKNEVQTGRGIALNDSYNFGPYAVSNMTGNDAYKYNFFLDFFVQTSTPVTEPITINISGYGEPDNAGGWYLISSPIGTVSPDEVGNMIVDPTPDEEDYDLFWFDQAGTDNGKEWKNYKVTPFDLETGKGYLYANMNDVTLVFTGTAFTADNGAYSVDLVYNNNCQDANMKGWNLVGNPFAVKAYIVDYNRDFYTMNDDGTDYAPSSDDFVQPMEGLFVKAVGTDETVTFSTTRSTKEGSKLALNLSQGHGVIDRAIVRFGEGRTLPKLQLNKNHTKVYIPQDGQDYAVVPSEEMGELPVNFKAENNGTYSLSFSSKNTEFAYLHLIDNMTGKDIDLLQTPSYSFEAKTTDYESRFKLVFATGDNSKEDNFAFFSNGSFVINNEGNATLQVIDITGRILKSESINGCTNVNVNAAPGVYMLRLVNGENVKVQKVVVE